MAISLRGLHPEVRRNAQWALDVAAYFGVPVTVTSAFRDWELQVELRRRWEQAGRPRSCVQHRGRTVCPANRPGDSAHNYGLAFDSVVDPSLWSWWTHVRELAGFEVLGHDVPHAQVPNWRRYVS